MVTPEPSQGVLKRCSPTNCPHYKRLYTAVFLPQSPRKSRGTSYDEQNRLGTLEGLTHVTTPAQSTSEIHWCLTRSKVKESSPQWVWTKARTNFESSDGKFPVSQTPLTSESLSRFTTDLNCSEPVETTVDSPLAAVTTVEALVLQTPEAYLPHHQPPLLHQPRPRTS